MRYNRNVSNTKIVYRKARSFAKGTIEGFLSTLFLPTRGRLEREGKMYNGNYRDLGNIVGFLATLASYATLASILPEDKTSLALISIPATNALSGACEFVRYAYRKIKGRKEEENE